MEEEKRKAYSEVVEILKLIEDEEKMERIPFEVIELIKRNSDVAYKPEISKEIPLEEQNLRDETYAILGWIANKYWNADLESEFEVEEKIHNEIQSKQVVEEESNVLQEKVSVEENNVMNAAVYNDIEPEILEMAENDVIDNLPILVTNVKWYQRIKAQVIRFFKTLLKIKTDRNGERIIE